MKNVFKTNNFDLIRLIAAFQVAVFHTFESMNIETNRFFIYLLALFPGVPIFFFTSGLLISRSYESNPIIKEYALNRILRIYPALIACTVITIISVYITGYFSDKNLNVFKVIFWLIGQISILQFYNPEFMRNFGTGVLNGILWTIAVEIQFYFLVPIMYQVFKINRKSKSQQNKIILILTVIFLVFNIIHNRFNKEFSESIFFKLFHVSFLPWFYMFLIGVYFQKNFDFFYRFLNGRCFLCLCIYLTGFHLSNLFFKWHSGNSINLIMFILLIIFIFSFAFSFQSLSDRLLKRNDISYGIYIYHIPVINLFIHYRFNTDTWLVTLFVTIVMASISWFFIEKKALKLKKHSIIIPRNN